MQADYRCPTVCKLETVYLNDHPRWLKMGQQRGTGRRNPQRGFIELLTLTSVLHVKSSHYVSLNAQEALIRSLYNLKFKQTLRV